MHTTGSGIGGHAINSSRILPQEKIYFWIWQGQSISRASEYTNDFSNCSGHAVSCPVFPGDRKSASESPALVVFHRDYLIAPSCGFMSRIVGQNVHILFSSSGPLLFHSGLFTDCVCSEWEK